jgi:hypothetical protein
MWIAIGLATAVAFLVRKLRRRQREAPTETDDGR